MLSIPVRVIVPGIYNGLNHHRLPFALAGEVIQVASGHYADSLIADGYVIYEIQSIPELATKATLLVGQVLIFAGGDLPEGWLLCDGQTLNVADYGRLFAVLGTTYGGDGVTTFAVPDLRGRAPIHTGQGQGLSLRVLGDTGGAESVALTTGQLPIHKHLKGVQ
jgi:hypothetical protein